MLALATRLTRQGVAVPEDTESVLINGQGQVFVRQAGSESVTDLGQLLLARFVNPAGLEATGGNLVRQSPASGTPILGAPGELGIGTVNQGALERSNVSVVEEMINMIVAQRSYQANAQTIKTEDTILQTLVSLR